MEKVESNSKIVGWLLADDEDQESDRGRESRDDNLTTIIQNMTELWHTSDKRSFATVEVNGAKENFEIDNDDFGFWLSGVHLKCFGYLPKEKQLADAI